MIIVTIALLGVIVGSFVNALVWRLHKQAELARERQRAKGKGRGKRKGELSPHPSALSSKDLSITTGRSMCPSCHHTLAAKDLVPVLSYVWLRGKCRYCGKPIPDSPIVEVAAGLLFLLSYVVWPLGFQGVGLFQFVLWLLFVTMFVALAVYDLRWFLLPDRLVLPVTVLAAVQVIVTTLWLHNFAALWQPVAGAAIIFGLFWGLFQLSKGAWIGGGDVKLAVALGLLAGSPSKAFLVIFFASLLGTLGSVPLLIKGKSGLKVHVPFGPYLLAATIIVVLVGGRVIGWYQGLLVG